MTAYYPGSKRKAKVYDDDYTSPGDSPDPDSDKLGKPRNFLVDNKPAEFYNLGALARVLNRAPVTVRKWEQEGIIPKAVYISPSHDTRGQRRLYTRDQIMGLRDIAYAEGLLTPNARGKWKAIEATQFKAKALELFRSLEGK